MTEEEKAEKSPLTQGDTEKITYLIEILSTVFQKVSDNRGQCVLAMTELLIQALSKDARDLGDLKESVNTYCEGILKPLSVKMGTKFIEAHQKTQEMIRKDPEVFKAWMDYHDRTNHVQVVMVKEAPPTAPTKH